MTVLKLNYWLLWKFDACVRARQGDMIDYIRFTEFTHFLNVCNIIVVSMHVSVCRSAHEMKRVCVCVYVMIYDMCLCLCVEGRISVQRSVMGPTTLNVLC